ncbi:MAG: hypothetical protein NTX22_00605 [Ignavibacteriales bacterium]|nr:hypothetical protein [Ignavibacteriales bacterium]
METKSKIKRKHNFDKNFDAVQMMCDIRDKISFETQNMSFEQLKQYIQNKLKTDSVINLQIKDN